MASDLPIFSALKARMHWHQTRQKLLSQNVANADSVGYKPRDLKSFGSAYAAQNLTAAAAQPRITSPLHISADDPSEATFGASRQVGFETVPSGNSVSLEDEMTKLAENQLDYQSAISLYTKSMNYLKIALGKNSG